MSKEQQPMTAKKKVSAFEYVIMTYADPDGAEHYEPFTKEEESKQREENIKKQFKQLK